MTEPGRIPKLASDTRRGYLVLIVAIPITLAIPFILVVLEAPVNASELAVATLSGHRQQPRVVHVQHGHRRTARLRARRRLSLTSSQLRRCPLGVA